MIPPSLLPSTLPKFSKPLNIQTGKIKVIRNTEVEHGIICTSDVISNQIYKDEDNIHNLALRMHFEEIYIH